MIAWYCHFCLMVGVEIEAVAVIACRPLVVAETPYQLVVEVENLL